MKSITFITLITTIFAQTREWFFTDHGAGSPVRCGPNGNGIECASDNNRDCKWGTYPKPSGGFGSKMSGVTAAAPLLANCPAWPASANMCNVLGCDDKYRFYYLAGGAGTPVRCNPDNVDEIQCASDNNRDCKWGHYPGQVEYSSMINVVSKSPLSTACPGWKTKDGKDMCAELQCYSTPPQVSRDCSVLAIDEFLLQCSSEFPAQQTAITDLENAITQTKSDLQVDIDTNTGDIAQLQTDLQNGNSGTTTQINSLQQELDDVNARINLFAAQSVTGMIDANSHSNNMNILSSFGFTFTDLFIILFLTINLMVISYIYCYKNESNNKIFKQ